MGLGVSVATDSESLGLYLGSLYEPYCFGVMEHKKPGSNSRGFVQGPCPSAQDGGILRSGKSQGSNPRVRAKVLGSVRV